MTYRFWITAVVFLGLAVPASAQSPYTWNTTDGNWNTAGNWLDNLNNPAVPVSSTTTGLIFNASGTTSYTATNDIAGTFILNSLTVNNSGSGIITLAGTRLDFGGTAPTLDVTGSLVIANIMGGTAQITKNGTGTVTQLSNSNVFTGTLTINAGTWITGALATGTFNFNPTSIVVNNGGTYQFGNATIGDPNLPNATYITVNTGGTVNWQEGEVLGGFHLQGGTINFQQGGTTSNGATAQSWTSGTLTGATFAFAGSAAINKTTAGVITIDGGASITGAGSINIVDGTITHVNVANLGSSNVTLGDVGGGTAGTFEYQGTSSTRVGTFGVNTGGGTIRVASAATTLTLSGDFSGAGALTKDGAGTLALTGALGHTGATTIAAGTLRVNPVTAGGGFAVANGATLAVDSGAGTVSFTTTSLSLGNTGSVVAFDLTGTPTVPLAIISAVDGLALNGGSHTLGLTSTQAIPAGTFTLIDYNGTQISSGFSLALPGRTAGSLVFDTANTRIDVNITGSDTIKWTGAVAGGVWDVGSAPNVGGTNSWQLVTGGTATNFIQTDTVTFDDTATLFTVDIATAVQPNGVTVNTANTYTFQGAGSIAGATSLTKQGTGTLVLNTANSYAGGTTISGGVLEINSNASLGADAGAVSIDGGTLRASTSLSLAAARAINLGGGGGTIDTPTGVTLTVGGVMSGTAAFTKTGPGTVAFLNNNNAFTGTATINGGTLRIEDLGAGGDFGAASIIINNGGMLEFVGPNGNPDLPTGTTITINTGGVAQFSEPEDYGAIFLQGGAYNSTDSHNLAATSILESGTLTGLPGGAGGALAGAGLIQKTTGGTVTLTGFALNNNGGLSIDAGVLSTDAAIGGTGSITIGSAGAATLQYRGASATVSKAISLAEGGGTFDVTQSGTAYTLSGVVSGVGALTKSGPGALVLSGNNDYQGGTTISGGTLLANGQTGANSGTGTGAVAVNSGGTLGGTGRVAGAVTVSSGGAIAPGAGGAGALTVAGNTVLNNGAHLAVSAAAAGANTSVIVEGAATTFNFQTGTVLDLALLPGFGSGSAYTVVAMPVGAGGNVQLNGATTTEGQVLGTFVQGTGASGAVTIVPSGFTLATGDTFLLSRNGDAMLLTFQPVPEPATVMGIAAGALGLGGLVRRRLRKDHRGFTAGRA